MTRGQKAIDAEKGTGEEEQADAYARPPFGPRKNGPAWADMHASLVRRSVGYALAASTDLHRRLSTLQQVVDGKSDAFAPLVRDAGRLREACESLAKSVGWVEGEWGQLNALYWLDFWKKRAPKRRREAPP